MKSHHVKLELLRTLSQGGFHSGQRLGEQLGMTRAAISKHIKGIQSWGVDVFRVQGKGYQLSQPLQLLDIDEIAKRINTPFELIPIIDSTNAYLLEKVDSLEPGQVCLSEYQSQGRGRRGREWVSPFGSNVYMSMYWRLDAGMAAAMGLSLVVGVAAVEALESLGIQGVKLKWPNDLYYQDKKLGGILVEMSGQAGGPAHLVIGMGLNIAMTTGVDGIDQPWTSLMQFNQSTHYDRNEVASALISHWQQALQEYEYQGMSAFVERWNRLDNFLGRSVKLLMGPRDIEGVVQGINEQGAITLKTPQGIEAFVGGEISLRKVD